MFQTIVSHGESVCGQKMRRDECWKVVTAELKVSACKVILGWIVEWVVCEPMRSV